MVARYRRSPSFLCLMAGLSVLVSCSTVQHLPRAPVPVLTDRQVMGFEEPPGMMQDPVSGQRALREVMEAYLRMKKAARKDGFEIVLISARRSFFDQRRIWNRKWKEALQDGRTDTVAIARSILNFTHVPGYSRHHWGTDIDLSEEIARRNMLDPIGSQSDRSAQFYRWLKANAPSYGFCQAYRGRGIVKEEPWHWTYIRLANYYEEQMERLTDFRLIAGRKIMGEDYLRKYLKQIIREQRKSVDLDCRSVYDEKDLDPRGKIPAHN